MQFAVVTVGRPRDAALAAAIREYEARVARYWPVSWIEVREEPSRGRRAEDVRAREGERLAAAVPSGARWWVCDARGKMRTSADFATWMQELREEARDVAFMIGGAFGLDDSLRTGAAGALSFGSMTLPHELARLVLAEQMYRAGTILRGEPYHK